MVKPQPQFPAKAGGLIPGSSQNGIASSGAGGPTYQVQSTVGAYVSQMDQKTTDDKYRVFSSVQGAMISQ